MFKRCCRTITRFCRNFIEIRALKDRIRLIPYRIFNESFKIWLILPAPLQQFGVREENSSIRQRGLRDRRSAGRGTSPAAGARRASWSAAPRPTPAPFRRRQKTRPGRRRCTRKWAVDYQMDHSNGPLFETDFPKRFLWKHTAELNIFSAFVRK